MKLRSAVVLSTLLLVLQISPAQNIPGEPAKRQAELPELAEASRLSRLVVQLFEEKKYDEALPLAKHALEIREKVLGQDHELVAAALNNIANIYASQQKYAQAEPLYKRSLTVLEKKWGTESRYLTETLETLAWMRFALDDRSGAEKLFLRSLAIKERAFGQQDLEAGRALRTLGVFYERTERLAKAAEFYQRSLTIVEKALGPNDYEVARLLFNCACALIADNKASTAVPYQDRANSIIKSQGPVRQSGLVFQGTALRRVEPDYPFEAKRERASGFVVVEVTVDECGRVIAAKAISGNPLLIEAAARAARQWRFAPTLLEGRPVKVIGTVTFNFNR